MCVCMCVCIFVCTRVCMLTIIQVLFYLCIELLKCGKHFRFRFIFHHFICFSFNG